MTFDSPRTVGLAALVLGLLATSVQTAVPRPKVEDPNVPLTPGSFTARTGRTRALLVEKGGGSAKSELAVERGLRWLASVQEADGSWRIDGNFPNKASTRNDTAGTAFGLLPFLGAGHTQRGNGVYQKNVSRGLTFLLRNQNRRTGDLGGGMYAHALAGLALAEAYALTKDPQLRHPAQQSVNYIVTAQHLGGGGWRYTPGQPGDMSVTGWQVLFLVTAQRAGLEVPRVTLNRAARFLDSIEDQQSNGYPYTTGPARPSTSALGLLSRMHLQEWGPKSNKMIRGIDNHLQAKNFESDVYSCFFASQLMYHFGGKGWQDWNQQIRDQLIEGQDAQGEDIGSWNTAGDRYASAGGRLMKTSLSLLCLEVYYRQVPLYR